MSESVSVRESFIYFSFLNGGVRHDIYGVRDVADIAARLCYDTNWRPSQLRVPWDQASEDSTSASLAGNRSCFVSPIVCIVSSVAM